MNGDAGICFERESHTNSYAWNSLRLLFCKCNCKWKMFRTKNDSERPEPQMDWHCPSLTILIIWSGSLRISWMWIATFPFIFVLFISQYTKALSKSRAGANLNQEFWSVRTSFPLCDQTSERVVWSECGGCWTSELSCYKKCTLEKFQIAQHDANCYHTPHFPGSHQSQQKW